MSAASSAVKLLSDGIFGSSQWNEHIAKIRSFLDQGSGYFLGRIQAPHGYGKSTDLVWIIWQVLRRTQPGVDLIYLQATSLECDLLAAYLRSSGFRNGHMKDGVSRGRTALKGKVGIMSFGEFARDANANGMLRGKVVFLVDEEISPSADGALAMAILDPGEEATEQGLVDMKIIACGCHDQMRDFLPGAKEVSVEILAQARVPLDVHRVSWNRSDNGDPAVASLHGLIQKGGRVVSFLPLAWTKDLARQISAGVVVINSTSKEHKVAACMRPVQANRQGCIIWVDGLAFNSVFPLADIKAVLASKYVSGRYMEYRTSLLVEGLKYSTEPELDLQLGYANMAQRNTTASRDITVYCDFKQDHAPEMWYRPRYLSGDIERYLFTMVKTFPHMLVQDIRPLLREARDRNRLAEAARRLELKGLFEEGMNRLTRKGEEVGRVLDLFPSSFGAACLTGLVLRSKGHHSNMVQRVLIRFAVFAARFVDGGIVVTGARPVSNRPALRQQCWSAMQGLVDQGFLWIVLGLWEKYRWDLDNFNAKCSEWLNVPGVCRLKTAVCIDALRDVEQIEKLCGLDPFDRKMHESKLRDQDIHAIQSALVKNWHDSLVFVPSSAGQQPFDLLSCSKVAIDSESFLDVSALQGARSASQPTSSGAEDPPILVMALRIEDNGIYNEANMLTSLPPALLKGFQGRLPWSEVLMSTCIAQGQSSSAN